MIVVSEETGRVSYARNGEITTVNTINELFALLGSSFQQTGVSQEKKS